MSKPKSAVTPPRDLVERFDAAFDAALDRSASPSTKADLGISDVSSQSGQAKPGPASRKLPGRLSPSVKAAKALPNKDQNAKAKPGARVVKKAIAKPEPKAKLGKRPKRESMADPGEPARPEKPVPKARAARLPRRRGLSVVVAKGGEVHIRHLAEAPVAQQTSPAPLSSTDEATGEVASERRVLCGYFTELDLSVALSDDNKPVWIQIAKVGRFEGHPSGPFVLTPETFDEICRNFLEVDGGRVAFDFEHASEVDPTEGTIPERGAPAQGWIHQLDNRGPSGLWGLVEWLEPARSYIREKKYRGVSPAIRFNARHPNTGKNIGARLTSAALTNKPFLRGMAPVTARDDQPKEARMGSGNRCYSSNEYMPLLRQAMGMHSMATARECGEHLGRLRELYAACGGDLSQPFQGVDLSSALRSLRDLMQMPMGATIDDLFEVVEEMIEEALEEHVEDFHTTASDGVSGTDTEGEEPEGATMADRENSVALTDAQNKVRELEKLLSDRESKAAELGLRLKDVEGRAEKAEAEVVSLRDQLSKRDEKDRAARVEEAFSTYKDRKNLTDADKEGMLLVLTSNPATFERMYPKVEAGQRHLMSDLSGARPDSAGQPSQTTTAQANAGAQGSVQSTKDAPRSVNLRDAARALAAAKGISLDQAQLILLRSQAAR